ncbi:hypothetical protein [Pseudomonas virus PBPA162]|uniref:Tail assembly chaperone n=3 Tax=Viruses TaxID=10239 RepID=A0A7S5EBM2_9CAUD|nr:tail assembly chaperone [Pseudomonas phage Iggy]YP_010671794.1 hypothetical protein PQC32_gp31 [Pseudomonas virus PBPA162]QDB70865.1 hypothetical protein [Pseudomonas virus PBPA162]QEA09745.1 hypothetical protein [Pseudomonas phage Iggy]WPK40872.1 tail assembly chaperone [Pseudomonas phage Knedl]
MSLFKQYKTDKSLEKDGRVVEFGVDEETGEKITMTIARAGGGNAAFQRVMEVALKPHRRQIENDTIDAEVLRGIMVEVYAKTVVRDWSMVRDEGGALLDCTEDNIVYLFNLLPDLFAEVQTIAGAMVTFREGMLEADVKN